MHRGGRIKIEDWTRKDDEQAEGLLPTCQAWLGQRSAREALLVPLLAASVLDSIQIPRARAWISSTTSGLSDSALVI